MHTLLDLPRWAATRFGPQPALRYDPGTGLQTWSYTDLWDRSGRGR
jgi:hypothetical protein